MKLDQWCRGGRGGRKRSRGESRGSDTAPAQVQQRSSAVLRTIATPYGAAPVQV